MKRKAIKSIVWILKGCDTTTVLAVLRTLKMLKCRGKATRFN